MNFAASWQAPPHFHTLYFSRTNGSVHQMNTVQAHVQSVLTLITAPSMTVWYIWGFQSTLLDLTGRTEAWVGDTTIEMVSHSEASCSVKEIKVHYRALFFPLCCLLSSSSKKNIFFRSIKWEYLSFIQLHFSLLGTLLAERGGYWKVSIVFSCSSCPDLLWTWTLAVCFCPSTKYHFYQQSFPFTPVYLEIANTPVWIVPKA